MFQAFEWFCPADQKHWRRLKGILPQLKHIGIDNIWIPPACKAGSPHSNGYDIYDLFDLGEFDQKGSVPTKWGSKEELVALADAAHEHGIGVIFDAVLGHKASADYPEKCNAVRVNPRDRRRPVARPEEIEAWVGFDFHGRGGKYSAMKYNKAHFNGVDYDFKRKKKAIYKLIGDGEKDWAQDVDKENGNFDYLLCANVDLAQADVRDDLFHWTDWISKELKIKGFRYDSAKHTSQGFIKQLIGRVDPSFDLVAEYTSSNVKVLEEYIDKMGKRMFLFDFALHGNFVRMSKTKNADLRTVLKGSLVRSRPQNSMTFVTNHDTQFRDQDFDTVVAPFFIPIAYAIILLSGLGGYPCVFYGDLFGILGPKQATPPTCRGKLAKIVMARKLYAYGPHTVYADGANCMGFTRAGHAVHSRGHGLAVLVTNGSKDKTQRMKVGSHHAGERWTDILESKNDGVVIDGSGWGTFAVGPKSVSIWVCANAPHRAELDELEFNDDIHGQDQNV